MDTVYNNDHTTQILTAAFRAVVGSVAVEGCWIKVKNHSQNPQVRSTVLKPEVIVRVGIVILSNAYVYQGALDHIVA